MARFPSLGLVLILAMSCLTMRAQLSAGQAAPAPAPDCTSALVELFPCLSFVQNTSTDTTVPASCCAALTNVSTGSPVCLCDFISPTSANQSAQLGINATRALELPTLCNLAVSPASCAAILGPSAAPVPAALVPVPSPAPIAPAPITPAPVSSPVPSVTPTPAPIASGASSPETGVTPGPASDCPSELTSLSPCLDFLTGSDNSPSTNCCTQFIDVVDTSAQCLCSLVSSSSSSTMSGLNVTLALELPTLCKVPVSLANCTGVSFPPTASEGPGTPNSPENNGVRPALDVRPMMIVLNFAMVFVIHFWKELFSIV